MADYENPAAHSIRRRSIKEACFPEAADFHPRWGGRVLGRWRGLQNKLLVVSTYSGPEDP